jgi:hypothetical protein
VAGPRYSGIDLHVDRPQEEATDRVRPRLSLSKHDLFARP